VSIGLRPEHIAIGKSGRGHKKVGVRRIEHLGDQTRMHFAIDGAAFVTLIDSHSPIQPGEEIWVAPTTPLFFDANGDRLQS
jgi:multiple sugar transport system ATP-binding protein